MVEPILNKVLFVIFFLCLFNIGRHGLKIILMLRQQDIPNKYELEMWDRIMLGLSFGYVLMTIFEGIRI